MRGFLMIGFLGVFAVSPASAQDWAKARLENSPRHQEWVTVTHGGRAVHCFVVYPEVSGKAPAVLVIHEIFGLTDWARSVADRLAEAGYVAIAPDLVSGMGPGKGGTGDFAGRDEVIKAVSSLPADQVSADLNATADYVEGLPSCSGHLAVVGFCWGGGQAFKFATHRPDLKAAFVFYGPPPDGDAIAGIQCPVYGFYGGNDARISSTVPQTKSRMKAAGKSYVAVTYWGAGHGFMRAGEDPEGNTANKKAHDEGWARLLVLLKGI
jgi:carboxymethylenebutenolidase